LIVTRLYFSFVQDRPERLSTALKESDRQLCSFAALVLSSCHLPSLLRSADFFLALRAFGHFCSLLGYYDAVSIKDLPRFDCTNGYTFTEKSRSYWHSREFLRIPIWRGYRQDSVIFLLRDQPLKQTERDGVTHNFFAEPKSGYFQVICVSIFGSFHSSLRMLYMQSSLHSPLQ